MALGQQASAVTLVENLTQSNSADGTVHSTAWTGSSFTTGSGSYNLESVTLLLQENTAGDLFVGLYGNNSGVPGTLITTFTNPGSITTSLANNTFTLATSQALTASTTYWLVSGILSGSGTYSWGYTSSDSETGLPGWTIGAGYVDSTNQGGTWISYPTDGPYQFSVNGTEQSQSIPEPSSVVALLGLGGLGLVSRLKKQK
ncbi:choice-of-anchor R domain-containing protein [Microcystis sp. M113S1]|uniref:choice-of-anchor R domain-containing protein n=1 Tax=Microcystis sp. M113S1 TaxID=2771104 RepID=UPI0025885C9C|nr:choice-of-anchor R domain-containing protein [Microcystis sp. M113S1]